MAYIPPHKRPGRDASFDGTLSESSLSSRASSRSESQGSSRWSTASFESDEYYQDGPLFAAIKARKISKVVELLSDGIDFRIKDCYGRSAVHMLAKYGETECMEALVKASQKSALRIVIEKREKFSYGKAITEVEQAQIDALVKIDLDCICVKPTESHDKPAKKSYYGNAALHLAAYNGKYEVVRILLGAGASPDLEDLNFGTTALHWAALSGFEDVVSVLTAHRAAVNAMSYTGQTPLHFAASRHRVSVVSALKDAGADPTALDENSRTPFDFAQMKPRSEQFIREFTHFFPTVTA